MIYLDPPYGIKFNSNWQVSTKSLDVRDGNSAHQSREAEVVISSASVRTNFTIRAIPRFSMT
jgi:hypothetical protein